MIEAAVEQGIGEYVVVKNLLEILKPGDVAFDVGASLGTHTLLMAKKVGKTGNVVAFEPERQSYRRLKANISLNGLNNVIPLKIALGEAFTYGSLSRYGEGFGTFNLMGMGDKFNSERIVVESGDSIVKKYCLGSPRVVKIDVEGYEYSVIKGLQETLKGKACYMVCIEIHLRMLPEDVTQDKILDLMKSFGFDRIETISRGKTVHAFCYRD